MRGGEIERAREGEWDREKRDVERESEREREMILREGI